MLGETGDSRVIRGLSGSAFCDATGWNLPGAVRAEGSW
jgi:hypothetical protein